MRANHFSVSAITNPNSIPTVSLCPCQTNTNPIKYTKLYRHHNFWHHKKAINYFNMHHKTNCAFNWMTCKPKQSSVLQGHLPGLQSHCIPHMYDTPRRTTDHLWLAGQQVLPLAHHPRMRDALNCHSPSTSWGVQHSQVGSSSRCPGIHRRSAKAPTAENIQTESVSQSTLYCTTTTQGSLHPKKNCQTYGSMDQVSRSKRKSCQ